MSSMWGAFDMIKTKISVSPYEDTAQETYWECPMCNVSSWFYTTSPPRCSNCLFSPPNLRQLKYSLNYRIDYHRGII